MDSMIRAVVRVYQWTPKDFESLYLDDADFFGLEYWYNDALAYVEETRIAAQPKKKQENG